MKEIAICIVFIASFLQAMSQVWLSDQSKKILADMRLTYSKPVGFIEIEGAECFENNPKLKAIMTCTYNTLMSDDEEVIAYMPLYRIMEKQDSIDINRMFPGSIKSLNGMHLGNIKNAIKIGYGKDAGNNWKSYVEYWTKEDAKQSFNADTVVSYSIKLNKNEFYKNKYAYLDALFIQKKDRGYVNFFFLYSKKAKKRIDRYKKAFYSTLRYED